MRLGGSDSSGGGLHGSGGSLHAGLHDEAIVGSRAGPGSLAPSPALPSSAAARVSMGAAAP